MSLDLAYYNTLFPELQAFFSKKIRFFCFIKKALGVVADFKTRHSENFAESFLLRQTFLVLGFGVDIRVIEKDGKFEMLRQVFYNVRTARTATAVKQKRRSSVKAIYTGIGL